MRPAPAMANIVKGSLIFVAMVAIVALLLPLLGVAAFAVRILVVVAIPVGIVALAVSPALRAWLSLEGQRGELGAYFGLRVPDRVMLHATHSWAGRDASSDVTVGADDLVQRALGPVESIALPELGREVWQGETLFKLQRGDRTVAVKAPVSGKVVAVNERIANSPELLNDSPYDVGWAVKLKPKQLNAERRDLYDNHRARVWFRNEVDRLLAMVSPEMFATGVAQDGGILVEDFYQTVDDPTWRQVTREFFGGQ